MARISSRFGLPVVSASADEFQRPTFVMESVIGDRAAFSGVWSAALLIAALEAMLQDAAGYAAHAAHFGEPSAT